MLYAALLPAAGCADRRIQPAQVLVGPLQTELAQCGLALFAGGVASVAGGRLAFGVPRAAAGVAASPGAARFRVRSGRFRNRCRGRLRLEGDRPIKALAGWALGRLVADLAVRADAAV